MNESLAIGWVYPGEVDGLFMQSVLNYVLEDARRGKDARIGHGRGGYIGLQSGPRIAHARNLLVNSFLTDTTAEWLLMVDTDMVFKPRDIDILFSVADPKEAPIVGGLYFGVAPGGTMFPQMFTFVEPDDDNPDPVRKLWDYPDNGLCAVHGTGAGFLLMHRATLIKIGEQFQGAYPWFSEGTVLHGVQFGEDMAFCVRALSLDIPVHVHTGAKLGHVKSQVMDEFAYKEFRARFSELGVDGMAAKVMAQTGMEKV